MKKSLVLLFLVISMASLVYASLPLKRSFPIVYKHLVVDDLVEYDVPKFLYKISIPSSWTEDKEHEKGHKSFVATSPSEGPEDSFIENITVVTFNNIDDNLKTYYKNQTGGLKYSLHGFKMKEEGEEKINDVKAKYAIYTYDYNGLSLKMMTYILIKNKTSYQFNATAFEGTFDQYKEAFQAIVRSIKISDPVKKK